MDELISKQSAIDALTKDKEALEHSINGMSGYEKEFDRFVGQRNQVECDIYAIEQLPPSQQEPNYDEWCTDCKEYDKERNCCPRWNKVIRQTLADAQLESCEDAVSRKAVKDGFVEMCNLTCPYTEKQRHAMCGSCLLGTAFDVLEATHSVTPKQRTGYWYPVGMVEAVGGESAQWGSAIAYHKCSECDGQALKDDFENEVLSEFCPHCGAKMEGVAE